MIERLRALSKAVRRDVHKTHAFVRFREVESEDGERGYRGRTHYLCDG